MEPAAVSSGSQPRRRGGERPRACRPAARRSSPRPGSLGQSAAISCYLMRSRAISPPARQSCATPHAFLAPPSRKLKSAPGRQRGREAVGL